MSQGNVMLRYQVMVLLTCGEKEKKWNPSQYGAKEGC